MVGVQRIFRKNPDLLRAKNLKGKIAESSLRALTRSLQSPGTIRAHVFLSAGK